RNVSEGRSNAQYIEMEALVSQLDQAAANGSSIAFVAEYRGKRCAFLADAHSVDIERSFARFAKQCGDTRPLFDAVKVAHHGSRGNITSSLLQRIRCHVFMVSTDGTRFAH